MKTLSVQRLVCGLLVGLISISFAILYLGSRGRFSGVERHLAFSLTSAGVIAFSLVGIIAWILASVNFMKMISARNKEASPQDAGAFRSFYVFTNAYLNESGRVARGDFYRWMIVFSGSVIAVGVIALIAQLVAAHM